ncbi:MAG: putative transporter [Bacteroides sp.]|nr:putative transporter [Bacteroides sp.]
MKWLYGLISDYSGLQAVILLSLICATGLGLGKLKIRGMALGTSFVFFIGIVAGAFGLFIDRQMLNYVECFGLVLFVYALGLQVGPGFFSSFRKGGVPLNMLAMGVIVLGTLFTILGARVAGSSLPDMIGVLCGATTNTPALGAAQQTLKQLGIPAITPALACAVAYPMGIIGVILAVMLLRKLFVSEEELKKCGQEDNYNTFVAGFRVTNPVIFNKTIGEIPGKNMPRFIISRLWRAGDVSIPTSDIVLKEGDRILVVTSRRSVPVLTTLFGEADETDWNSRKIDWNSIDAHLVSRRVVITRPEINGKKLGALRLRNEYGVNVSRVYRSGIQLLATSDFRLQYGDRLTVIGEAAAIDRVGEFMGNTVKNLNEPNLIAIFTGIVLGLVVGSVPLFIPGITTPVKLGLAGGPIIVEILMGAFGPGIHMITYTTISANLMLRSLGISLYLACLGLDAGANFLETIFRPEGLVWIGSGALITIVPIFLMGMIGLKVVRLDFGTVSGMMCGSMSNPMALNYVNDIIPGDIPSLSYATVYPLSMFLRVIIAQVTLMFFL